MKKLQLFAMLMLLGMNYTQAKESEEQDSKKSVKQEKKEKQVKKEKAAKKEKPAKKAPKISKENEEVYSVRRDIRILQEHMKIKNMSHHQLSSFVSRIEAFMHDLKKDKSPMSDAESKVLSEAIAKANKAFKALPKDDQDKHLMAKIKKLKN
ncbi:hypothetical protein KBC04_02565 [Candidatus Babeliales bacterium]|nr:hypothetical protein [Candidatus Babeliales bacterium]MBP9844065.1 hypothetical protein [Candidatus Babeliales bacterium]